MELWEEHGSGDELLLKIAQHTADEWLDMYRYEPFYAPMPQIYQRYKVMSAADQKKFNDENPDWVNKDEGMVKHAQSRHTVGLKNDGNKHFLEETAKTLGKDTPRRAKVEQVLAQYPTSKVRVEEPVVEWDD
jgi:hypothetical protein